MLDFQVLPKLSQLAIRPSIKYSLAHGHEQDIYIFHLDNWTRRLHSTTLHHSTLHYTMLHASCLVLGAWLLHQLDRTRRGR